MAFQSDTSVLHTVAISFGGERSRTLNVKHAKADVSAAATGDLSAMWAVMGVSKTNDIKQDAINRVTYTYVE